MGIALIKRYPHTTVAFSVALREYLRRAVAYEQKLRKDNWIKKMTPELRVFLNALGDERDIWSIRQNLLKIVVPQFLEDGPAHESFSWYPPHRKQLSELLDTKLRERVAANHPDPPHLPNWYWVGVIWGEGIRKFTCKEKAALKLGAAKDDEGNICSAWSLAVMASKHRFDSDVTALAKQYAQLAEAKQLRRPGGGYGRAIAEGGDIAEPPRFYETADAIVERIS